MAKQENDRKSVMEMTVVEAAKVIRHSDPTIPIMLWGQPGIAKTATVTAECADAGAELSVHNLNEMEPTDLLGIPYPEEVVFKYKVPYFWYRASTKSEQTNPMWIFFDDVVTASEQNQCALFSWVRERRNDLITLRDNVRFILAGNRVDDKSGVQPMPKALANRMLHLYIRMDTEAWLDWARKNGIHPWCVGYIRTHPHQLNTFDPDCPDEAFATPRSMEMLSRQLHAMGHMCKTDMALMSKVAWGLIGTVSTEFYAWVKYFEKTISPEDIVKDPKGCRVPKESELDILHATVASLEHYLRANPKVWHPALIWTLRINPDLGLILAKQIVDVVIKQLPAAEKTKAASSAEFNEMFKRWGKYLQQ